MKMRKETAALSICLIVTALVSGCRGEAEASLEGQVIMEKSAAEWTKVIAEDCGISDFGRPKGTVKETLKKDKEIYTVTFEIDDEMTQELMDGYAQSVWRACEKAAAASNRSSSGYIYDDMLQACKRQEPLNYYIWYYTVEKQKFRLGLYSTNMEEDRPGGLVLKIEAW